MSDPSGVPDLEAALRLFDETVRALEARARRLEEVLTVKQQELAEANGRLGEKVNELDQLSRYLELVLSSVASGVVAVDCRGLITTVNPAARRMYAGLDRCLEGSPLTELFPDSAVSDILAGVPGPITGYRRVLGEKQDLRQIEVVASPIIAPDGAVVGAVEVLDDVTDMRRLQEEVERGQRLKSLGEMAAGVAHEIRNPLNGIEGFASLLIRDLDPESRSAKHAQAIVSGVRDLNRSVSGLLQFTHQKSPQKRSFPLDELLYSVCDLVRAESATEQDSQPSDPIHCDIAEEWQQRSLYADPGQIRQVILNLLQNAMQAVPESSEQAPIHLRLRSQVQDQQNCCLIEVADAGPGIAAGQQAEIFTPFFTTKEQGTGLGLAIVHQIISLHEGGITVDRDPQLGGARFQISLPDLPPR